MPDKLVMVKVVDVTITKLNPREHFDKKDLERLGKSIKEEGLVQPIVVRPKGRKFELAVGERRLRAARMAKVHKLPAIVRDLKDGDIVRLQLTENLLRKDLNPLEEAKGFLQLRDQFGMIEEEIGKPLGRSQPYVSDRIRLLGLPDKLHQYIAQGILTVGHAKALLKLKSKRGQLEIAKSLEQSRYVDETDDWQNVFKPTVRSTEEAVDRFLRREELQKEFQKVMKTAKVKKCPKPGCGNKAVRIDPDCEEVALTCRKNYHREGHSWDPQTGEVLLTPGEKHWKRERSLQAAARVKTRKARVPEGEKHVPTMPAWWFSKATKREWAEALLEETADQISDIEVDYSGITLTMDDINLADLRFEIVPVDIVDGDTELKTMITMGEYRSTRSQQDNVARGDEVPVVTEVLEKLLSFQRRKVGVKQTKKETMIRECNGLKLGDRVKISKTCLMSSYRGAGADIVGFDDRENAVLNYSKCQKVVGIGDLEVVVKKDKPTS